MFRSRDRVSAVSQEERRRNGQTLFLREKKKAGFVHQHLERLRLGESDVIVLLEDLSITRNQQYAVVSAGIKNRLFVKPRAYPLKGLHQWFLRNRSELNRIACVGARKGMFRITRDTHHRHVILRQYTGGLDSGKAIQTDDDGQGFSAHQFQAWQVDVSCFHWCRGFTETRFSADIGYAGTGGLCSEETVCAGADFSDGKYRNSAASSSAEFCKRKISLTGTMRS